MQTLMLALLWSAMAQGGEAQQDGDDSDQLAVADSSDSGTTDAVGQATALLSRFSPGQIPVEPGTIDAIGVLANQGGNPEISLLRNLAENERAEIRAAATHAITDIRDRQIAAQRDAFARTLPNWPELNAAAHPLRRSQDISREEARCAAYTQRVLGNKPAPQPDAAEGDPWELLALGKPLDALKASRRLHTTDARLVEARAREELGDLSGALQEYAWLAALGDAQARDTLDRFGVDAERLLLGLLVLPNPPLQRDAADILEVLVHYGGQLSVEVLADRTRRGDADAGRALGRMLDALQREIPLPTASKRSARRALVIAARERDSELAEIARQALADLP